MKNPMVHEEGDCRITKMRLIREVNNDMCHNFYYEARFRLYTNANHYYKGNFVVWFDTEDLAEEYPDKEFFSKKDIKDYALTLAGSFMDYAPRKNINGETMRPFYAECRKSIEAYNGYNRTAA